MSLYFDLVICCYLKEDVPEAYIEAIRSLTDPTYNLIEAPNLICPREGNVWESFYDYHFLAPDPKREAISNFQRIWRTTIPAENRDVYQYCLQFSGRMLHDDFFYVHHLPFVCWLASIVDTDFIGYYKETDYGDKPRLLYVKDSKIADW
jgi:hypothetical protein